HDDLLRGLLFVARPAGRSPLQELRAAFREIDDDRQRGREIGEKKNPGLPVIQGSRGKENRGGGNDAEDREGAKRGRCQVGHAAPYPPLGNSSPISRYRSGSSAQFSLTFTKRKRWTFWSAASEISARAAWPIALIVRPPSPITIFFCPSRAT